MRRFREARASILRARFSLSAVSSSTELEAVFTSIPSFLSRSMTSWLERLRSLASWKTLTLTIRLSPLARHGVLARTLGVRRLAAVLACAGFACGGFAGLGARGLFGGRRLFGPRLFGGRLFGLGGGGGRGLLGLRPPRLFLGGQALGLDPRRFFGVLLLPLRLGRGRGLADLLGRLGPDALDRADLLVGHLQEVVEPGHPRVDQLLGDLVGHPVGLEAPQL